MRLKVNPNRMEVLRLRRRLGLASRGHELLKDKLDELMRRFMQGLEEARNLRDRAEDELTRIYRRMALARGLMDARSLGAVEQFPGEKFEVAVETVRLLNLRIPRFELRRSGSHQAHGFRTTCADLDKALGLASEVLPELLHLAGLERALELLAAEIESTRRRVNALEYILIPSLEETIRWITMKLAEAEREATTRLIRIGRHTSV